MKRISPLLLSITLATIELRAQLPPMPVPMSFPGNTAALSEARAPMPLPPGISMTNTPLTANRMKSKFAVNCPHCGGKYHGQTPLSIMVNGGRSTNGGVIQERTLTFTCPNAGCRETISAKNEKFVPEAVAVEEVDAAPTAPLQVPSASIQSWTTDPNLRLTISYTNFTNAIPWPVTAMIPSGAGTFHSWYSNGVQVVTNTNQFTWTTNSVAVSVICGPAVMLRYPTEVGKTYKCQATDDGTKTWLDGYPVAGTGGIIVNYEAATKPNRFYRVVEL